MSASPAPGQNSRRAATALLGGVLVEGRTLAEQSGDAQGPLARIEPAERARAQTLAGAALRHLGRVDAVLGTLLQRPPPPFAMNVLRLAVIEMLFDHVPPHAAVDGAVRQMRADVKAQRLAGLVNAVARRVSEDGAALWGAALEAGLPEWLAGRVRAAYGSEALEAIERAHARGAPPPVDLTIKEANAGAHWAEKLGGIQLPTGSVRLPFRAQVSALAGYDEGAWWVQDAAAAVPVRMLGDLSGLQVLDLCAAPGGKTMQLAAAGAKVTALDVSEARLGRLRENLARTGLTADVVVANALAWEPTTPFDVVLVDAPCSASGTIRRHPDLPYVRAAEEVTPLVKLQAAVLARAWRWVAPGGRMLYCTCSLLPAEGETQIARFRERTSEAVPVLPDPKTLGIDFAWCDAQGGVRLRPDFWEDIGGMDGFYAALLAKPAIAA